MKTSSTKPDIGNTSVQSMFFWGSRRTFRLLPPVALALVAGGILSPRSLSPQQRQPSSESTLVITAQSKGGAAIELSAADLEIKGDGKQATVLEVRRVSGAPLHYCIVFDSSGSARAAFELQQKEATELLARAIQAGRDRGWFVPFDSGVYPGPETDNPQVIAGAIVQERPRGVSALYDAMVSCAEQMSKSDPVPGQRTMFIFSDGQDNSSHSTRDATMLALVQMRIRVYAVGQKGEPARKYRARGADILTHFAKSTGGRAYFPQNEKDVDESVRNMADEFASTFLVAYTSADSKRDGRLHKLQVTCRRRDVSITAPDRYYAPLQ